MNETTILETRPNSNGQKETKKEGGAWKQVTLGGVSGILMGAGVMYAGQAMAQPKPEEVAAEESAEQSAVSQSASAQSAESGLHVATAHNDMSFGEAFAAARAEVGPGGVFYWHGGIYNTYIAEEWNAMTPEQKHDFAQQVKPQIGVEQVSTPTDANTHIIVEHHVYHHGETSSSADPHQPGEGENIAQHVSEPIDPDVHIVGYGEVEGHLAVGYDTTGDGQADVAIIDVDDSGDLTSPDVIVDSDGNMATVGEIVQEQDPYLMASMENPDVAPDMPDYMNEANVDDTNMLA
jgi:hypothetical protein